MSVCLKRMLCLAVVFNPLNDMAGYWIPVFIISGVWMKGRSCGNTSLISVSWISWRWGGWMRWLLMWSVIRINSILLLWGMNGLPRHWPVSFRKRKRRSNVMLVCWIVWGVLSVWSSCGKANCHPGIWITFISPPGSKSGKSLQIQPYNRFYPAVYYFMGAISRFLPSIIMPLLQILICREPGVL